MLTGTSRGKNARTQGLSSTSAKCRCILFLHCTIYIPSQTVLLVHTVYRYVKKKPVRLSAEVFTKITILFQQVPFSWKLFGLYQVLPVCISQKQVKSTNQYCIRFCMISFWTMLCFMLHVFHIGNTFKETQRKARGHVLFRYRIFLPAQGLEFVTFPQCLLVEKYWLPRLYHENRECVKTWTSLYCELKCTLRTSLWPRNFAPYPVSLRIQSWDQSSIKMYLGSLRLWNFRGNAYNKSSIRTNTVKYLSIPRCLIKAWEDRDCGSAWSALRVPSSCKNEYQLNWLTNVPYAKRMPGKVTIQEAAQLNDLR